MLQKHYTTNCQAKTNNYFALDVQISQLNSELKTLDETIRKAAERGHYYLWIEALAAYQATLERRDRLNDGRY